MASITHVPVTKLSQRVASGPENDCQRDGGLWIGWLVFGLYVSLALCVISRYGWDYPALLIVVIVFMTTPMVLKHCRPRAYHLLCPQNLAFFLFFVKLIAVPMSAMYFGWTEGTLPWMPSPLAINVALLVDCLGYVAFCICYQVSTSRRSAHAVEMMHPPAVRTPASDILNKAVMVVYLCLGAVGLALFLREFGDPFRVLLSPAYRFEVMPVESTSLLQAASTFLRPFLGYALVMAWGCGVCRLSSNRRYARAAVLTVLCIPLLFLSNFNNYNRATMFVPIVALCAAYSMHVRRIRPVTLVVMLVLAAAVAYFIGIYRSTNMGAVDLLNPGTVEHLFSQGDYLSVLQTYGGGSQYLGFLLEETNFGNSLKLGQTLLSSVLYPVPVLGKSLRASSAVVLYNRMIYGNNDILDQVVPFTGELFFNFHFVGVLTGFGLLGCLTSKLQQKFRESCDIFQTFSWFMLATWALFAIIASIAVVSQMYVVFLWPVYAYAVTLSLIKWTKRGLQTSQSSEPRSATEHEDMHCRWNIRQTG